LLVCAFAPLLAACGVAFSDPPQGNEFFKSLTVMGNKRVGQPLTAVVTVKQSYAIAVPIRCELRQKKSLVKALGEETAPANPEGNPKATPIAATLSFNFTVDAPGDYGVECFTTADEDNYIAKALTIASS
jgi:hypothetical protein